VDWATQAMQAPAMHQTFLSNKYEIIRESERISGSQFAIPFSDPASVCHVT
jgi:hypothetical protein